MRAWRVFADEFGQVPVLAVETASLLSASGLDIEVGQLRDAKRERQKAADAAAPAVSAGFLDTFMRYDSAPVDVRPVAGNGTVLVQC